MSLVRILTAALLAPAPSSATVPPPSGGEDEVERSYAGPDAAPGDDDARTSDAPPMGGDTDPGGDEATARTTSEAPSPTGRAAARDDVAAEAPAASVDGETSPSEPVRPSPAPPTEPATASADASDEGPKVEVGLTRGLRVEARRASMHLGFFTQVHVELLHDDAEGTRGAFRMPFARPYIETSFLGGRFGVFVQAELANAPPRVLDVVGTAKLYRDALTVRFGQFRPPTSPRGCCRPNAFR
ncbi:MAG: hypothetical protein D6705_06570 [Deltaproteobacteria bacterium]|nr:MAG: hypothetical protein D6705_06570 [Deltaproteobacteria bacterium]